MTSKTLESNSYHTKLQKGEKVEIEMPPLTEEVQSQEVETTEPQVEAMADQEATSIQPVLEKQEQQVEQETKQTETTQAKNFRTLKAIAEKAERERDELLKKLQEIEAAKNKPQEVEEDYFIKPDDLVEGKHLSKIEKKYKKLEQELASYKKEASILTTEARLKAQFPDFDSVVSKENVEAFKMSYPELAQTINSSNDIYNTAVSAYTLIKKLGIHVDNNYHQQKALAQKNASKPKPLASISPQQGDTPLSRANAFANGLTEELQAQLRKEMFEAMKNR